jgi:predicted acylesterase/phospholipase RssA
MSAEFDTLVLSGGSIHGIAVLGSLQFFKDNSLISNIQTYVGTSVGSIICYLMVIGYTPIEIMVYLCTNRHLFEKLKCFDIIQASRGEGATTFLHIAEQIEKMTIDKTGRLFTMKDVSSTFKKRLIFTTYNMTQSQVEYLSPDSTPDLPCITALRMSSNLPLVFESFKYGESFYIDGGLSNNFALDIAEENGSNVLGITFKYHIGEDNPTSNLLEYIYKLLLVPIAQSVTYRIKNKRENTTIIELENYINMKFFEFNINSKSKLELFSCGYEETKQIFLS